MSTYDSRRGGTALAVAATDHPDMQPAFDPQQFRAEVRAFCRDSLPPDLAAKSRRHEYFSKEDRIRWQRILHARGWYAGHWPQAYGGQGWGPLQRFICVEELEYTGTPWLTHFGISFAGPVIYTFGSDSQKQRYLPGILNSDTWWCQGFSEPGAGSDLASLRTRAVRHGDHYRVTGQKTWTTMAQWSDMMFCLVRTGAEKRPQQGISFLLIDLKSPGVTVRPIATIDRCHHINEVFLDDVEVPVGNLVGREGDGWTCTKFIVSNERLLVTELGKAKRLLEELRVLAAMTRDGDRFVAETFSFRRRLAELEVQLATLEALAYAAVSAAEGGVAPGPAASVLKIRGSEMQQAIFDAIIEVLGHGGLAFQTEAIAAECHAYRHGPESQAGLLFEHLHSRATSIYGGSNEIQRHILAKAVLGL